MFSIKKVVFNKTPFLIVVLMFFSESVFSQTALANDGNGSDYWTETQSWVDSKEPTCSDYTSIIIPDGVTIIVKESVTLDCAINLIVERGACLRLKSIANKSTILTLGAGSKLVIEEGASLETDRHNSSNHATNKIIINSNKEWDGVEGDIAGYKEYPSTLPIELLSFTAKADGRSVLISWSTATETNNDFFTIERSYNGLEFEALEMVYGQGNSTAVNDYSIVDENPIKGTSYYRLKQTDYDGKYEIFDLIGVTVEKGDEGNCVVTVYPNPCLGNCTVKMSPCLKNTNGKAKLRIMDSSGRMIMSDMPDINGDGSFTYTLNSSNNLSPGIYLIKSDASEKAKQLIIRK